MTKLRELIEAKKINLKDMAYTLGVSNLIVQKWADGKLSPRLIHAMKIVKHYPRLLKLVDLLKPSDLKIYMDEQ